MYNNRNTQILEREETRTENSVYDNYVDRAFTNDTSANMERIRNYEKFLDEMKATQADVEIRDSLSTADATESEDTSAYAYEDITPTSTTMQFKKGEQQEIFDEIRSIREDGKEKNYRINTKGKILIAVYALVVATIFSLILLNAKMLKNLDGSIENYSAKIVELSEDNQRLTQEFYTVRSDEVVKAKAAELGMVQG